MVLGIPAASPRPWCWPSWIAAVSLNVQKGNTTRGLEQDAFPQSLLFSGLNSLEDASHKVIHTSVIF